MNYATKLIPHQLRRRFAGATSLTIALLTVVSTGGEAATHQISVQEAIPHFDPLNITIEVGDTVQWVWADKHQHSVTSGRGETNTPDGIFNSGSQKPGYKFSFTFQNVGTFRYFCDVHNHLNTGGTWPDVTVVAPNATPAQPLNVSTRLRVQSGENSMIGGFIITGNAPKRVIVRAIGPSLSNVGVSGALQDPTIELVGSGGGIGSNDNWKDSQQADIQSSGVAPSDERESALVATLPPGNYTAVVQGKNGTTGVGLVEVYDLDQNADSKLANISTRGVVETESNVMIGGFVLGKSQSDARVIVRALGPSLSESGISGVLADPVLDLRNSNGDTLRSNNNWRESQQGEIEATGIPPRNDLESAVVATLPPGFYTAVVAGNGGTTGVGLVEVYQLQ